MVLTAISLMTLAAWIFLAATRLPPLGRLPRLAPTRGIDLWPAVAAVIPARNEEETIGPVVAAHAGSDYPGPFSLFVVDDHSTDATAARAVEASDGRLTLVSAPPLPAGWTGKLWAVNSGLQAANRDAPDAKYILLTDADIVLSKSTLRRLVAQTEDRGDALTSLMARLDARGSWGGLLIPAFVYFFYKLYPFHVANDAEKPLAAAAGGCMLVRRDALEAIGGVNAIRGKLIDDCALASAIKSSGRSIWLGAAADEAVSLRDNRSLSSIWSMVARSAFAQLNHSWLMLAGAVIGMILIYLAPPAIALSYPVHHLGMAATLSAAAWGLTAFTYRPVARLYGQAWWKTFFLPAAAFLYTLMTISSALNHARGKGGRWKGRTYPA